MAEYINREAVLKHKRKMQGEDWSGEFWDEAVLCEDIRKIPAADVVEVVRCKDCAYYREETSYCLNPHCSSSFYGHRVKENHYCSYGERSEE